MCDMYKLKLYYMNVQVYLYIYKQSMYEHLYEIFILCDIEIL